MIVYLKVPCLLDSHEAVPSAQWTAAIVSRSCHPQYATRDPERRLPDLVRGSARFYCMTGKREEAVVVSWQSSV